MPDHLDELEQTVRTVVSARDRSASCGALGADVRLWGELDELGFTALTVPEKLGGSGGDLRDAAAVIRAAAVTPVPLAESNFLAGPVLAAAGLPWPGGMVTAAAGPDVALTETAGAVLHGRVARVPWLRDADHLVLLVPRQGRAAVAVVPTVAAGLSVRPGRNLAGEPRDTAVLDAVRPSAFAALPDPAWHDRFATLGAVARAVQTAGAAAEALALTARHVHERVQFGRPLARFQAVQHLIARLACDVTAVRVGCDAAVLALRDGCASAPVLAAAAKAEASVLAGTIAATSHQLHGAIGVTREHRLGTCTGRLWAWREEYGNEVVWQTRLATLLDQADQDPWALLTGVPTNNRKAAET